ncbi:NADH-quinone oxidoreductase subunit M [bacterium]|nr:MAG: NADH-quinone oxidoreductase subunit M [bacterium]
MSAFFAEQSLGYPILSILIFLPIAGALVSLFLQGDKVLKSWAFAVMVAEALVSIPLFNNFDPSTVKFQFTELTPWVQTFHMNYALGVDGISILLVMLTTFVMPLCILCSWKYIEKRVKEFVFALFILEAAMIGVFCALDLVLFYVFWEAMLIPMYLLIAIWGGDNKAYASLKFFLYTLAGSVLLLVAIIALYLKAGTFFIPEMMGRGYPFAFQFWVFLAFALAFAIKVPMFPFHTWLPAAHVEAPTAGSVILAAVLLKMGTYGFLRFCLPITPSAALYLAPVFLWGSIASILYGGFIALGQKDIKKLIAYSSVGHMGFVTLGIFLMNVEGIEGALLQMINHGITTGALFICIGIIYERSHSRQIKDNSAIGSFMPVYVAFLGLFSLSSLGFPGTNSFVGELLVLIGAFKQNKLVASFAIPGALLAATYMLRLLQKIIWDKDDGHGHHDHGEGGHAHHFFDVNLREFATLTFLAFFVVLIGLAPKPFISKIEKSVANLVNQTHADIASGSLPEPGWNGFKAGMGFGGGHGAAPSHGGEPVHGEEAKTGEHSTETVNENAHGEAPAHGGEPAPQESAPSAGGH